MPNYTLRTGIKEQDRSLKDYGFNGQAAFGTKVPSQATGTGKPPGQEPCPLVNAIDVNADSTPMAWPAESAGEINERTRNMKSGL